MYTGRQSRRVCLVLDCLTEHAFTGGGSGPLSHLMNLQHYIIKEKKLPERETVQIFYDIAKVSL